MGRRNEITKKISAVLLTVAMLVSLLVGVPAGKMRVVEAETTEDGFEYSVLDDGTIEIIGYLGGETELVIPDEIEGISVTSIGREAFENCEGLVSITLPVDLKNIGESAFWGCTKLKSIEIPNGVTNINGHTFWGCSSLLSVTLPSNLASIGESAFTDCFDLTTIELPDSVVSIGEGAFWDCDSLKSIKLSSGLIDIGDNAFYDCTELKSIEIPDSVVSIGESAFRSCNSLTYLEIPDSVTYIGNYAFSACEGLSSIAVAVTNETYNSGNNSNAIIETETNTLIAGCTTTIIPESVTSIGEGAFWGYGKLTSINIPSSVTEIGSSAFEFCEGLTSINIPNSVTEIGSSAFGWCESLASINISNSVSKINSYTFEFCEGLTSINIPNSVTEIGSSAFAWCDSLTSVEIPDSVTSIGDNAFERCYSLTSIEIPNSVTYIGHFAFYECETLTSVKISNNVININNSTFCGCSKLESIEIPSGVVSIGRTSFSGCTNAKSIIIPNSMTSIGEDSFSFCYNLKNIEIPDSVTEIEDSAFEYCENLVAIKIPSSVVEIGESVLSNCSNSLIVYADENSVAALYAEAAGITVKPIGDYSTEIGSEEIIDGADIVIDDTITTDDLIKDHPEALYNQAYNNVISMLYEDCAEAVDIYNSDFGKQLWSSFKYGLTDGPEILVKSTFGSIFGDNILYREFIDEEVEDLMASVSGNSLLLNEAVDKVEKAFDATDLIKDAAGNTYDATQKKKIIKALANTKYFNTYKAKKLCEKVEKNYDKIDKAFESVDVTISVADAIITVAQICSIKIEMVDTVMESIPKDTDLYKSLERLRNRITSEEYLAYMIAEEKIFDEIAGFVSTASTYAGIRLFSDIALKEAAPAMFFGELVVNTWATMIPEASADDLVKANLNNGIFNLLSGAVNAKYVELVMLKQQGATDAQIEQAKKEYKILYVAHIEALKNAIETAATLTEPSSLEKFYDFFNVKVVLNSTINRYHGYLERDKKLVDMVTYDGYMNSCLYQYVRKHETQYLYEVKDGKATIIGCSVNGVKTVDAQEVSANLATGYSNTETIITNMGNSATLTAYEDATTSYDAIIMLPDAVGDVPVTAVDSEAFAGSIANAVVVLPDSIETIATDSFDSNSNVLLIGKSEQGVEACATATNNTAHVIENSVESIEIVSLPDKLTYTGEESLDEQGMTLRVTYSNGTESEITKGWSSYIEQRQLGTNTVTVGYAGCSTSYEVTVTKGDVRFTVYFRDEYGNDLREKHEYTGQFGNYYTVYNVEIPYYTAIEQKVCFLLDGYKEIIILYKENETINIENAKVSKIENQKYTGAKITPDVEVSLGGKKLTKNVDYELEYFSNIEEGTAEIIIWGIGIYSGEVVTSFQISKDIQLLGNVGKEVTIGNSKYIITNDSDNCHEVSWKGLTDKKKKSIKIPAEVKIDGVKYKVTSVESNACKGNKKITKIAIGKNVKVIGKNAFSGCARLKKITLGKGVTTVKSKAFYKCTALTKITIPKKVSKIEKQAFEGCKKLKKITIKSTVLKSVGKNAIKGINKKATITVPKKQLKKYKKLFKSKTGYKKTIKIKK